MKCLRFFCSTILLLSSVCARSPAFLAEPGPGSALDAAASDAGRAAGKEASLLLDGLLRPPIPTTTVAADTSVAAPSHSPATTPSRNASQEGVPNFQLGAFLLDHAARIAPLQGGNGSHLIQASRLAQYQLQAEASHWMALQPDQSLEGQPDDDSIPRDILRLPEEVSATVAGFNKHLANEALNATYYMEQFDKLLHQLEDPTAIQAGAHLFSNSPCLFSTNLGALEASATGVNLAPALLSLSAAGINVSPQAISISPALLSMGATGVNISPQGLNIGPALIAVTPGRVAVNPQGGNIAPVGLSVTAPAGPAKPAKPSLGRRALRETLLESLPEAVSSMIAGAEAAATDFLGVTPDPTKTLPAAHPAPGPAQLATKEVASSVSAENFTLPVALHGLQNWAAVIGTMCKASNEDSVDCLHEYFNHTFSMLDSLTENYKNLEGEDILAAVARDFPKLEVKKPSFYSGSDDVAATNVAAIQLGATGLSVSPCAVPISPVGVNVGPTAVNVAPTLISVSVTGINVQPQALNVSPDLIVVGPYDTTIAGQGLNIAPALITVSPTKTVVNPVGPLNVAGAQMTKTLPALPDPDNNGA